MKYLLKKIQYRVEINNILYKMILYLKKLIFLKEDNQDIIK